MSLIFTYIRGAQFFIMLETVQCRETLKFNNFEDRNFRQNITQKTCGPFKIRNGESIEHPYRPPPQSLKFVRIISPDFSDKCVKDVINMCPLGSTSLKERAHKLNINIFLLGIIYHVSAGQH